MRSFQQEFMNHSYLLYLLAGTQAWGEEARPDMIPPIHCS